MPLYFTSEGITFALAAPSEERGNRLGSDRKTLEPQALREIANKESKAVERWVVKLGFVGADRNVKPVGETETGTVISYFKGKPEEWHAGLPAY
jgi:hypothetical protein